MPKKLELQESSNSQKNLQTQQLQKKKKIIERINLNPKMSKMLIIFLAILAFSTFLVQNVFMLCVFLIISFSIQIVLVKQIKFFNKLFDFF